ncbi:MAG: DUF4342 domain-containing protein [Bacillota bacterium]
MEEITLEKIDLVRERMGVSYKEAREALEKSNGSVVEALVMLESKPAPTQPWREEFATRGNELLDRVKSLIREGNISKIRIKQKDRVLFELPVTAGAVGAFLAPQLAIIGTIAAVFAQCTIEVERPKAHDGSNPDQTCCGEHHDQDCCCGQEGENKDPEQL